MKVMLALTLASVAAPVLATGFTAADLGQAAEAAKAGPARQAAEIAEATEQLRLAIAYDTGLGLSTRTEAERNALLAALPTGEGAGDLRVQWFMAGAIAQPYEGSVILLYHPLARGTLALDWVKEADGWRVRRAGLSAAGRVEWPEREGSWRKAFAEDYAASRARIGENGRIWWAVESDRWLDGLATALSNATTRSGIEAAGRLIADGRTAKMGGGGIDLLPATLRAAFAPVAALPRDEGGLAVIYGMVFQPDMLIAGDFAPGGRLQKLSLINLGNVGGGQ